MLSHQLLFEEFANSEFIGYYILVNIVAVLSVYVFLGNHKRKKTIVPYYDLPKNLTIADLGYLYYNDLSQRVMAAIVAKFAIGKYITIKKEINQIKIRNEEKKIIIKLIFLSVLSLTIVYFSDFFVDGVTFLILSFFLFTAFGGLALYKLLQTDNYVFIRTKKKMGDDLDYYEKIILQRMFKGKNKVDLWELALIKPFVSILGSMQLNISRQLRADGYLMPKMYKFIPLVVVGLLAIQWWIAWLMSRDLGWRILTLLVFVISSKIIFSIKKRRTSKAEDVLNQLEGVKLYLTVAEKDRLKFHNAPLKNPVLFQKLLPVAILLGVEKQWADQFEEMVDINSDIFGWADNSGTVAFINDLISIGYFFKVFLRTNKFK